ncbi:ATP-binding protein [Simiduia curdlanivorans]|uniref:histidine kinase n=1 Tax=Simiduia curdlanivorans TaxID=1492769 RepID=A0ABV8V616_9GAMM|nr:ATP-binding protein [Simiduia curdlanivorans]MDN3640538.1 ATP-binding protein [Simiduia curdlanivorans]
MTRSHSISRMSFGLFVAAVVLVVPLMVLVYLYLTELNREIKLLDRQISSVRVMQQFVALQINLTDEYYGRFYPSNEALQQFSEPDEPLDTDRSRAEPIALMTTQFTELEQELNRHFKEDFSAWPIVRSQLTRAWENEVWPSCFKKLQIIDAPISDFVNDLFMASNLGLSSSEQIRTAAHLLFVGIGKSKFSLFDVSEQLAQLVFLPPKESIDEEILALDSAIEKLYSVPLSQRAMQALGDSEFLSGEAVVQDLQFNDLLEMSKRLLEKKRRFVFIDALESEMSDMGLAVEVETLRGLVWDRFNSHNRVQIQLARLLEQELNIERDSVSDWRALVLLVALSLTAFGVVLGTYIITNIRIAQEQLGSQNISLEETVKSRTKEIVTAKNEAEKLNKILGKQTQLSSELARKAEMANSAKSLFLAAMSHEIRTPLNAVLGGANVLAKSDLNPRQRSILNLISQSGKTLLDLINEILDFSKIEADQLHLESVPFDLELCVVDVVSMFSLKAKEKDIYLRLFVDSKVEGLWVGDSLRIKQIVINLLSNAIKFTHIGGVSVKVSLSESGDLVIGVHDTGIGVKSDQLKNLFEAFVQSDSSTTRKYGGTGLGLSISKRLAVLHGGDISVESALGRGSSFLLSLPLERSGAPVAVDQLTGVEVFLLSGNPELERQLRQWCSHLQVFEDVNQLVLYLDELHDENNKRIVIVAESSALIHHHDQWVQEVAHRDVKHLEFPWVLLTSQDAIDCDESLKVAEALQALDANIQMPLLSRGLLIRQAIKRAYKDPNSSHENWMGGSSAPPAQYYSGRVLLVEDVDFNRIIARELLESFGLVVECVENGVQAVDFMEGIYQLPGKGELPIKLILMDLHMPEMNGLDATRRIREIERLMCLPPISIVAMTADVLVETREDIVLAGMNGYLPKPFEESDLHEVLSTYFSVVDVDAKPAASMASTSIIESVGAESDVFDHDALSRRLRGRTDRVAELAASFLSGLPDAVKKIKALLADENYQGLIFAAHTLKGSAANLGALQLQQASAGIERLGKKLASESNEQDLTALQAIVDGLPAKVIALESEINSYISSL